MRRVLGRRIRLSLGLIVLLVAVAWLLNGCLIRPNKTQTRLTYKLPTTIELSIGETLAGTQIQYQSMDDQGAHLLIDGQQALKRTGDSLNWQGTPTDGVTVNLILRIAWFNETGIRLVGVAEIEIQGATPRPAQAITTSKISYSGPVAYGLAKGATVPGSTVVYEGETEEGARLGGIEGYPYRRAGDSVFWEGALRDNVYIRLDLRVVQYDERGLRVGGLVTLWIGS